MPYKDTWGEKAKERARKRTSYFVSYRKKTIEKVKARRAIKYLVSKGLLKKGACKFESDICNKKIEGHHPDYSKPLEVVWLCSRHHRLEHNRLQLEKNGEKNCLNCGKIILPPKNKYCSNSCNLVGWRKGF